MRHAAFASALLALIFPTQALASRSFPVVIDDQLSLPAAPSCQLCHLNDNGGFDSVVRPFGLTAKNKYGLTWFDIERLKSVITRMEVNGDDSDGDGAGDIAELRAGTDPNFNELTGTRADGPSYGIYCATASGRNRSTGAAAWLTCFFLTAWRMRLKGRRGKPSSRIARNP